MQFPIGNLSNRTDSVLMFFRRYIRLHSAFFKLVHLLRNESE